MKPRGAGPEFRNDKGFDSLILQAAADSDYQFLFAECGSEGSTDDWTSFVATEFCQNLVAGLDIPSPEPVGEYTHPLPYCFVGDAAYSMRPDILNPYPQRNISAQEDTFNKLHGKASQYIDRAFGVMTRQFGVLQTSIGQLSLQMIETMVLALCVLHNVLRRNSQVYRNSVRPESVPVEDDEPERLQAAHYEHEEDGQQALQLHTDYANYLQAFFLNR